MTIDIASTYNLVGYNTETLLTKGIRVHVIANPEIDLAGQLKQIQTDIKAIAVCITDKCDENFIETLSTLYPQCKLIANYGVGYNHIDMSAAARHKIRVTNTPGVLTDATADIALALLLMTTRRLFEGCKLIHDAGRYPGWAPDYMLGQGIQNKTVGVIGFGEIGKAFAKRVESLGAKVVVLASPWTHGPTTNRLGEDEFLLQCDVISFHCKLTNESRGWLSKQRLEKCKKGVVILNTARGELIDEDALANALNDGRVSAAGLDVFCNEPVLSDVLQSARGLIVLPHLGSATLETRQSMSEIVVKNILAYAKGEQRLPNEINFFI